MRFSPRMTLGSTIGFLILGMSLLAPGCGRSTGTVNGKVSLNGTALKGGTVAFLNDKKESIASAEIKEDGSYSIAKIPPGNYKVTVETESFRPPDPNSVKGMAAKTRPAEAKGGLNVEERSKRYMPIPMNYRDPDQSGLTYTVTSGSQTHDIPLQ